MRSRHRFALSVLALAVVLSVPLGVWGASSAAEPDDDIPGVALPSTQPVTGEVDSVYGRDNDDVYSVQLPAGKWFWAHATGSSGTDFDLYLFGPDKASVKDSTPGLASSERENTSDEMIRYFVPASTPAYLNVYAFAGAGSYKITYGFATTVVKVSARAQSTCSWGGSTEVTGTVTRSEDGQGVAGEPVTLYHKPYGASRYKVLSTTTTVNGGAYSFTVKPTRLTGYRVRHLGSKTCVALKDPSTLKITPKAYLGIPRMPSTVVRNVPFTVYGYLNPRHKVGEKDVKVRMYLKRADGSWVWRKTYGATNADHDGRSGLVTKYSARVTIPSRGEWRIRAYIAGDNIHASTYTEYVYRLVR